MTPVTWISVAKVGGLQLNPLSGDQMNPIFRLPAASILVKKSSTWPLGGTTTMLLIVCALTPGS
jgi:hypothetical protein